MPIDRTAGQMSGDALRIAGETFVPGASLLANGEYKQGLAHVATGFVAKAFLGPVGALMVCANSFSKHKTGKGLWANFSTEKAQGEATLREEVEKGVKDEQSLEQITKALAEDVQDLYEELNKSN